jgi:hypothetical protein
MAIRRNTIRAALVAGVVAGFACQFAGLFPPLLVLAMVASGGLAVTVYHRRMPAVPTPASRGFRIGMLAGFFAWVTSAGMNLLLLTRPANRDLLSRQLHEKIAETVSQTPDPAAREMIQKFGESITTPSGLIAFFAIAMIFLGIAFLILGGLGGAIGAAVFGHRPHQE